MAFSGEICTYALVSLSSFNEQRRNQHTREWTVGEGPDVTGLPSATKSEDQGDRPELFDG
jgi:hypothetical protein